MSEQHHRYLRLLGFDEPPRGLVGLRQLVIRQLCRVPFENVSKLLLFGLERTGRVTTFSEYLDGIEHHDLGGTCYTANPFFYLLLAALDYDVDLLGADMSTANVHTCIRVRLDGDEYHLDVGYAAPFRTPIRLRDLPLELKDGQMKYVVSRSGNDGELTVGVYAGLDRIHGYRAHEQPRTPDFFRQTILDSYLPDKTFMTCLRISRFAERSSVHLRNRVLTVESDGLRTERELHTMSELREAVKGPLAMPRCPIAEAVSVLEEVTGQPYFG